jgi:hypothetical protein
MIESNRPIAGMAGVVLAIAVYAGYPVERPLAQGPSASAPSTIAGGGTILHSVSVEFPDPGNLFPGGDKADAINSNCLGCHSAGMALTQPHLSRAEWQAEVDKMRSTYKAPIVDSDVPAIVDYLANLNSAK